MLVLCQYWLDATDLPLLVQYCHSNKVLFYTENRITTIIFLKEQFLNIDYYFQFEKIINYFQ